MVTNIKKLKIGDILIRNNGEECKLRNIHEQGKFFEFPGMLVGNMAMNSMFKNNKDNFELKGV